MRQILRHNIQQVLLFLSIALWKAKQTSGYGPKEREAGTLVEITLS